MNSKTIETVEFKQAHYLISTDNSKLDLNVIHDFLRRSYWAFNRPLPIVRRAIENSLCFGMYQRGQQIGFARVISDFATFAYLADVFILEAHRGKGLGKWLIECIMHHPRLQGLSRWMLATKEAHGLYAPYGFTPLAAPERFMEKIDNPGTLETAQSNDHA